MFVGDGRHKLCSGAAFLATQTTTPRSTIGHPDREQGDTKVSDLKSQTVYRSLRERNADPLADQMNNRFAVDNEAWHVVHPLSSSVPGRLRRCGAEQRAGDGRSRL
jgi:hypothetical protein